MDGDDAHGGGGWHGWTMDAERTICLLKGHRVGAPVRLRRDGRIVGVVCRRCGLGLDDAVNSNTSKYC